MAAFSDTLIRTGTPGISVVFAYKLAPFPGNMQGSESCNFEDLEPAYDIRYFGPAKQSLGSMQLRRG